MNANRRLQRQLDFIVEIDRLKTVLRQTVLTDGSRRENSAEHSWHLGVMAMLLAEYADSAVDLRHVIELVLVHDLVEIDAGDTFAYDSVGNADKAQREHAAANRLFGMLPPDQQGRLRSLWDEFEAARSVDARFAVALDRLQPLLQNVSAGGGTWRTHGVSREQILTRMSPIRALSAPLWTWVVHAIDDVLGTGDPQDPDS